MANNLPPTPPPASQVIDLTATNDYFISFQLNDANPEFIRFLFHNIFPQYGLKVQDVNIISTEEQQEFDNLFNDLICNEQLDTETDTDTDQLTE